jgi:hypothetical protein
MLSLPKSYNRRGGWTEGRQMGAGPAETVPGRAARAGTSQWSTVRDRCGGKDLVFVLGNVMRPEELPNWDGAGGLN